MALDCRRTLRDKTWRGRIGYRKNFQYQRLWGGRYYAVKQVLVMVAEESEVLVVVTVYIFYF